MRTSLALLLLGIVALIGASSVRASEVEVDGDEPASVAAASLDLAHFSFYDYLHGEWEVYRHVVSYSTAGVSFEHSLPAVRWKLAKENNTNTFNLFGRAWLNGSSELDASLALRVEFQDFGGAAGKFQSGPDEDALSTLFTFAFHQPRTSIPLSAGTWHGADVPADTQAAYVMQASSPDRFTITVTPRNFDLARASVAPPAKKKAASHADDEDDIASHGPASTGHPLVSAEELAALGGGSFLYVGHRVKAEPVQTFYQKYGTMLLLGCFLVLQVWMRSRQSMAQMNAQSAARKEVFSNANAAQRAAAAKRLGAKVELAEDPTPAKKDK